MNNDHNKSQLTLAEKVSEQLHSQDRCAQTLGMTIDKVSEGYAELSMVVSEAYANGLGACQGGIITTLADTAFAHACNSYDRKTVASGLSIDFLRAGMIGDTLTAISQQQHRGNKTGLYTTSVYNQKSELIAIMSGRSYELKGSVTSDQSL